MGVKDAGVGLNHAHSAIEGLDGGELALAVRQDGGDAQTDVLGVHFSGEAVADALLGARGDLDAIASGSQVTDDLALLLEVPEATSEEVHGDGVRLIVDEVDHSLGRVAVHELDSEDLRGRERNLRLNLESDFGLNLLGILMIVA